MAYGNIEIPQRLDTAEPLPILSYGLPSQKALFTFPLTLKQTPEELRQVMWQIFAVEIERGSTYPHRGEQSLKDFLNYYYSAGVVIVGIVVGADEAPGKGEDGAEVKGDGWEGLSIDEVRAGRSWEGCLGGFYYIKPNYPGRSSHNCNAGFMVNQTQRGLRVGLSLGRSYLIYAPKLGYRASVFNLVYTNNSASVRIWDSLGFTRAGLIPEAGLLKKADGSGEEFVDAIVFYKKFE
ncbi:Acyl-CoA N-acyltransferase [Phaffia rhodozyma]|uniref:Acyl-CoA N-acyltransferase n=1 Tax=Phaffia rhodozyma TaxID=264483 RepID=A0A0F7SSA6_PHARH|nr:Acyl-CoA N-acyltransferase [Phaffia rhodozyma]